jgi:hypothetical protein
LTRYLAVQLAFMFGAGRRMAAYEAEMIMRRR